MFQEYYPIADSDEKKFIIMQDDKDGRLAILKTVSRDIIEKLKNIDSGCDTLPTIYEFGKDYIIEENFEGINLYDVLENSLLSFREFVKVISDLCKSLTELHKNELCHMDISLENIVKTDGKYILIDFSASKAFGAYAEGVSYGTMPFCSPEHFGFDTISAESDVYSMGKLVEVLLHSVTDCGKQAFSELIKESTKVDKHQRIPDIKTFWEKFNFVCQRHTDFASSDAIIKSKYRPFYGGFTLTEDMLNSLSSIYDLTDFIKKNEDCFEKIDVVDYFDKVFKNKGLKKSEVIQQAEIERTYGYQILNGTKKPSRDKLIQLCFGAKFTFEETQMALKKTGFAPLYPKNKRDCIIIYAIKSGKSVTDTDGLLYRFNECLLNDF